MYIPRWTSPLDASNDGDDSYSACVPAICCCMTQHRGCHRMRDFEKKEEQEARMAKQREEEEEKERQLAAEDAAAEEYVCCLMLRVLHCCVLRQQLHKNSHMLSTCCTC